MKTWLRGICLICTLLVICTSLYAQQSFQVLFTVPDKSEAPVSIIEDEGGDFLSVGTQTKITNPTLQGMMWKINKNGDTLSKVFSFGDSTSTFSDIRQIENGNYMITGLIRGAPDFNDNLLVIELNSELQIVNKKVTVLPEMQKSYVFKMKKHLLSYYVLLGNYGPNSNPPNLHDPYFIKLNSNFDTVMTRRYYIQGDQFSSDIIFSPDGSQMWIFAKSYFPQYTGASLEQLVIYDTLFNFISVKTFQDYFVEGNTKAKWLSDSTFLLGFQHIDISSHEEDLAFKEIDSALILTNVSIIGAPDTIDYLSVNAGIDFANPDSILFAGTKNVIPAFWPQESSWLWVGLLDRNLEPLYQRFYGGDAYYHTISMIRTRDGGAFIAAIRYNYLEHNNYNDAFFLKVNNDGLVTGTCDGSICPLYPVLMYPNPGKDYVNLELSWNSASCQIVDLNGRLISQITLKNGLNQFNSQSLKSGAYLFKISNEKGEILTRKWYKQ